MNAAFLLVAAATALTASATLNAHDVRATLYGTELSGTYGAGDRPWRECIEPGGRTIYAAESGWDEGLLSVRSDGKACFAYRSSGFREQNCFAVRRQGASLNFQSSPESSVFTATSIRRGVRTCAAPDAPVS